MKHMNKSRQKWILGCLLTCSLGVALAQDTSAPQSSGGWRRFDGSNPPAADQAAPPPAADQTTPPPAGDPGAPPAGAYPAPPPTPANPQAPPSGYYGGPAASANPGLPPEPQGPVTTQTAPPQLPPDITLPAGTWITIRVNEPLSSDHSKPGDAFTGTLAGPIVVNGLVIARPGQMVTGVVSEAQKAGRVEGVSHLGLELTEIQLANGNQVQVRTRLLERRGSTSKGRDAAAIGATTATGAAIGAAVNGGVGAGVGAGAGLVVSTIGVLLTRGRPTVVFPETPLTFALQAPLTVPTSQAFVPAPVPQYNAGYQAPAYRGPAPSGPAPYGTAPAPYYGGYYAPAPYYPYPYAYGYPYPYYWGPSVYFGFGRGWGRRW